MLELEAEERGNAARLLDGARPLRLRQVHELPVVTEILILQLWMPIEPQRAHDQTLEMAQEEIREIEGSRLALRQLREHLARSEKLVAVGTGQALDAFLREHLVELSAGTAVTIDHKNTGVA